MKTTADVLNEWVMRGYITEEDKANPKYLSYLEQSKAAMLAYCNIPPGAGMPDGLFYAWVEIGWGTAQGTITVTGSGEIKSISEGDTSVTFDVGTSTVKNTTTVDYTTVLRRYRRLP